MSEAEPLDAAHFLASTARLMQAGILASVDHDETTGEGHVSFTHSFLKLLLAGREPMTEPGLQAAWASGDPGLVRLWIETEAAHLPDPPLSSNRSPGRPQRTAGRG